VFVAPSPEGTDEKQQQQQQQPTDQQLLGRRLLQALVGVWGDKSKNNSGTRMCFYAQVSSGYRANRV
jgi:hypothetical protein